MHPLSCVMCYPLPLHTSIWFFILRFNILLPILLIQLAPPSSLKVVAWHTHAINTAYYGFQFFLPYDVLFWIIWAGQVYGSLYWACFLDEALVSLHLISLPLYAAYSYLVEGDCLIFPSYRESKCSQRSRSCHQARSECTFKWGPETPDPACR